MRPFPRTPRQRLVACLASATLALTIVSPLAQADIKQQQADARKDQKTVRGQIGSAKHDLQESSKRYQRAAARLSAARGALRDARTELDVAKVRLGEARAEDERMQDALERAEARLAKAEEDVALGKESVADQSQAVSDMVNSIYQQGDPQLLALSSLLNAESPADLTREREARSVIVGEETRAYDNLRAAQVLLQVREQQVADATEEVAVRREEAAAHLVAMKELTRDKKDARVQVRLRVSDAAGAQDQARRARARDRRELAELERREARIQKKLDRLAAQARREARNNAGNSSSGPRKGVLMRPSRGYTTSPFGYRTHPIYGYYGLHDGVDFGLGCGTPLYAVGSGKVISRWYSAVYGNRLYVNLGIVNGRSVVAIYNHLASYSVGMGDTVRRGQQVGTMGDTGWSTGCHLHFTLMVNGRAVDPMPWF